MNRARLVTLSTVLLLVALAGCGGRHVVVEPETAARANDRSWKITSQPGSAASATPTSGSPP